MIKLSRGFFPNNESMEVYVEYVSPVFYSWDRCYTYHIGYDGHYSNEHILKGLWEALLYHQHARLLNLLLQLFSCNGFNHLYDSQWMSCPLSLNTQTYHHSHVINYTEPCYFPVCKFFYIIWALGILINLSFSQWILDGVYIAFVIRFKIF